LEILGHLVGVSLRILNLLFRIIEMAGDHAKYLLGERAAIAACISTFVALRCLLKFTMLTEPWSGSIECWIRVQLRFLFDVLFVLDWHWPNILSFTVKGEQGHSVKLKVLRVLFGQFQWGLLIWFNEHFDLSNVLVLSDGASSERSTAKYGRTGVSMLSQINVLGHLRSIKEIIGPHWLVKDILTCLYLLTETNFVGVLYFNFSDLIKASDFFAEFFKFTLVTRAIKRLALDQVSVVLESVSTLEMLWCFWSIYRLTIANLLVFCWTHFASIGSWRCLFWSAEATVSWLLLRPFKGVTIKGQFAIGVQFMHSEHLIFAIIFTVLELTVKVWDFWQISAKQTLSLLIN
jgi:hypothetical protein